MEIKNIQKTIADFLKKYRFVILILSIGLVLMLLPSGKESTSGKQVTVQNEQKETMSVEERLTKILKDIHGAGDVKVMLTEAAGEEKVYQTDEERSESENESDINIKTVIVTDSEKNESPVIIQTIPPKYLGAIVVCRGADSASVRLAIVEAVTKITGLGSDCISVLKMK